MKDINHSKIKETNRKKIVSLLLEKSEITKLDISRMLDISITTVATNINELKELGIVEDVRSMESTGGRKAKSIRLIHNCRYSVGIAITPNHIKIHLVNIKRELIDNIKVRHKNDGIENLVKAIKDSLELILKRNNVNLNKILGIGISIPGVVNRSLGIIKKCYFLNLSDVDLCKYFKEYNVPIYINNEANLSAYYEFLSKYDIKDNILYMSITDGLGLGIVINGQIYEGNNNAAGEYGHTKIEMNGELCKCGRHGCLEVYTTKMALVKNYNKISENKIIDSYEFEKKYFEDNSIAKTVFKQYIKYLSIGISNLIMMFDPGTIVIGGDINSILKENINELVVLVNNEKSSINNSTCNIEIASLEETYLLGAARVPIEEYLSIK